MYLIDSRLAKRFCRWCHSDERRLKAQVIPTERRIKAMAFIDASIPRELVI
jgi:hypothetical protein